MGIASSMVYHVELWDCYKSIIHLLTLIKLYIMECGHVIYPYFRKCVQSGSVKLEWWRIFPVYIKYCSVWLQWQHDVQWGARERLVFFRDHICVHHLLACLDGTSLVNLKTNHKPYYATSFFFLEHAGELRIIILRRRKRGKNPYNTHTHLTKETD